MLYPNDNMYAGKLLRLQQQYLWTSASLQDILRRFTKLELPWAQLPEYVCIQSTSISALAPTGLVCSIISCNMA